MRYMIDMVAFSQNCDMKALLEVSRFVTPIEDEFSEPEVSPVTPSDIIPATHLGSSAVEPVRSDVPLRSAVASEVRNIRSALGMTQSEFAGYLGKSSQVVSLLECSSLNVKDSTLNRHLRRAREVATRFRLGKLHIPIND